MPSGLSQSHQEIAGQFQRELLQLICLGSGGQHVQRPPPRGMGRPIGLQCPCNSFTRQEVRGASDSTNQRIENNALVSSSGITGGARRRVVYLVVSYSPVRGSAKDTRLRIHLDRQAKMVQLLGGRSEWVQAPRHRHPTARCPNGPPTANRPLTLPLMPKPSQIDLDLLLHVHRRDSRGSSSLSCRSGRRLGPFDLAN